MCYPMGSFWARTRPSLIFTHEFDCHVFQLPLAANVSSYSMPSFREKPHAMILALYPTIFPSTVWWNYELPFMYRYCILDIILLEMVFRFFLATSSSMISLHSSYYSSSWIFSRIVITCSLEQVSTLFACRWLYMIFPTSQMHLYD